MFSPQGERCDFCSLEFGALLKMETFREDLAAVSEMLGLGLNVLYSYMIVGRSDWGGSQKFSWGGSSFSSLRGGGNKILGSGGGEVGGGYQKNFSAAFGRQLFLPLGAQFFYFWGGSVVHKFSAWGGESDFRAPWGREFHPSLMYDYTTS